MQRSTAVNTSTILHIVQQYNKVKQQGNLDLINNLLITRPAHVTAYKLVTQGSSQLYREKKGGTEMGGRAGNSGGGVLLLL